MTTFWQFQDELVRERHGVYSPHEGERFSPRAKVRRGVKKVLDRMRLQERWRRREEARLRFASAKQRADMEACTAERRGIERLVCVRSALIEHLRAGGGFLAHSQAAPDNPRFLAQERVYIWTYMRPPSLPGDLPEHDQRIDALIELDEWDEEQS